MKDLSRSVAHVDVAVLLGTGILTGIVVVVILFRFGILALSATAYTILIGWSVPLTIDPDAWYFGRSMVGLLLIAAIAASGFALAVRGKGWLPRIAVE